ncbi:hypothetical protein RUND412_011038 [Rhizina undulata]
MESTLIDLLGKEEYEKAKQKKMVSTIDDNPEFAPPDIFLNSEISNRRHRSKSLSPLPIPQSTAPYMIQFTSIRNSMKESTARMLVEATETLVNTVPISTGWNPSLIPKGLIGLRTLRGERSGGKYTGSNSDAGSDDPHSHPTPRTKKDGTAYSAAARVNGTMIVEPSRLQRLCGYGEEGRRIEYLQLRSEIKALCQVIQPGHVKHETIGIHNQATIHNRLLSESYDRLYSHLDWGLFQELILDVHKNLREGYLSHQATITGQKRKRGRPVKVKKEANDRHAQGIKEAQRPKAAPSQKE